MPVRLNGSTSGYTELSAPAAAGNNSITLPTGNGNAYQIVRNSGTAGSLEFADKLVSGTAQNSTSGTSIDFTGIPSWAKRVTMMFDGVSTSGTSNLQIQIGSGSFATTGYVSASSLLEAGTISSSFTSGFGIRSNAAAAINDGAVIITRLSGNAWCAQGVLSITTSTTGTITTGGSVTLSGALDRVRITTLNGTDAFDAGSINIMYE
jgi:hypothetical protein